MMFDIPELRVQSYRINVLLPTTLVRAEVPDDNSNDENDDQHRENSNNSVSQKHVPSKSIPFVLEPSHLN